MVFPPQIALRQSQPELEALHGVQAQALHGVLSQASGLPTDSTTTKKKRKTDSQNSLQVVPQAVLTSMVRQYSVIEIFAIELNADAYAVPQVDYVQIFPRIKEEQD